MMKYMRETAGEHEGKYSAEKVIDRIISEYGLQELRQME